MDDRDGEEENRRGRVVGNVLVCGTSVDKPDERVGSTRL